MALAGACFFFFFLFFLSSTIPEWPSHFPYFFQCKSEFGNKEFMIWATGISQSSFCWLYRASPSLSANIINLLLVLTIWWCSCVQSSLVLLEEGICYDQCNLLAKLLLAFVLFQFILQSQTCLLLQVSLDFLLLHSSPPMKRTLFLVLVLESLVGIHRTIQLQFL